MANIEMIDTESLAVDEKWFDLKLNRDLLDNNFEGYKLSLDALAKYNIDLISKIDISYHNDIKTSKPLLYQHIKLFGFHNHLFNNQFLNIDLHSKIDQFKVLYYFDTDWSLIKIVFNDSKRFLCNTNLKLEKNLTNYFSPRVNITMKFLAANLAIISDGCDIIYFCEIFSNEDKNFEEQWCVLFKYSLEEHQCCNSVIKDATLIDDELNLLLMNIHEDSESKDYKTMISYLKFKRLDKSFKNWAVNSCKKINCFHTVPEYVSVTRGNDDEICVIGSSLIKFIDENGQVIKEYVNKRADDDNKEVKMKYEWNELGHDVTVFVNLNEKNVNKRDLKVNIGDKGLEITFKNEIFLSDNFFSSVDKSDSSWQIDSKEGLIEISLKKKETLMWSTLFKNGDKFGKYQVKSSPVEEEKMESEEVDSVEIPKKIFNLNNDLEECDGILNDEQEMNEGLVESAFEKDQDRMATEEDLKMIMYLDLKNRRFCARSYVSNNKFLFEMKVNTNKSNAICLRHDVDGVLWQPENFKNTNDPHFSHIHTFLAFGYIQASKQNSKFQLASPNFSYVCIFDTSKHLYIYKEKSAVNEEAELRNRKTGKTIKHVSKQYVINLESDKEIMGVYCSNEHIVVLLEDCLKIIQVQI
jgi:hypothetical protein